MGIPDMEGHRYLPFYLYLVAVPEDLRLDNDPIALAAVYTRLK